MLLARKFGTTAARFSATPADIARRAVVGDVNGSTHRRSRSKGRRRSSPKPSAPAKEAQTPAVRVEHDIHKANIAVVGVGGAGCNAVNSMIASQMSGVNFVVVNTDAQSLSESLAVNQVQLGSDLTGGLGAGANPDIGEDAAITNIPEIMDMLHGSNMVFITGGMGGGTGTGAAPVIAQAARDHGMLTVGIVSTPFAFEGSKRTRIAAQGLARLEESVDTLIVVPNERLLTLQEENLGFKDALSRVDAVLHEGVKGVSELIVNPGLINVDFADVQAVMTDAGRAFMGTGYGTGEDRHVTAVQAALGNPLLADFSLGDASGLLVTISGGPDLTLFDVEGVMEQVRSGVPDHANIIFGTVHNPELVGSIGVSIIVSGVTVSDDSAASSRPRSQDQEQDARVDDSLGATLSDVAASFGRRFGMTGKGSMAAAAMPSKSRDDR